MIMIYKQCYLPSWDFEMLVSSDVLSSSLLMRMRKKVRKIMKIKNVRQDVQVRAETFRYISGGIAP